LTFSSLEDDEDEVFSLEEVFCSEDDVFCSEDDVDSEVFVSDDVSSAGFTSEVVGVVSLETGF